jgi:hypothetical protein
MIWVVGAGGLGVILLDCFMEGDGNSSTNTPGGTFALSDPSLARMLLQCLSLVERARFLVLRKFSLVFVLQRNRRPSCFGTVLVFVDLIDDYS